MHSIAVRVPNRQEAKFWELDGYASGGTWTLERRPPHVETGDYLYFTIGTELVARAPITGFVDVSSQDGDVTGPGPQVRINWDASSMERLDPPVTFWVSKGFRYVPTSVETQVKAVPLES